MKAVEENADRCRVRERRCFGRTIEIGQIIARNTPGAIWYLHACCARRDDAILVWCFFY